MLALLAGYAPSAVSPAHAAPPSLPSCLSRTCVTVTVDAAGNGSGTVTTANRELNCVVTAGAESGACSYTFISSDYYITFEATAEPSPGSHLEDGTGTVLKSPWKIKETYSTTSRALNFYFVVDKHEVAVSRSGSGTGRVVSTPAGVNCGHLCSIVFSYGSKVALTAIPDASAEFTKWTGACAGQAATCHLTVNTAVSTTAVFGLSDAGGTGGGSSGGGGTSGGGTSGGGTSSGGSTGGGQADRSVEVELIGVRVGRSRLGTRIVKAELNLEEHASATLTLVRRGKALVVKQIKRVKQGDRVLLLVVPNRIAKGKATLSIRLQDQAGNRRALRRLVTIQRVGSHRASSKR
jgi:Divergent InlB B-repeat domain